jgi:hypothetical protein
MATVIIRLDPGKLQNPDLDIRYALPDAIVERSNGNIQDDAYDYAKDVMSIFLIVKDLSTGIPCIVDVIENVEICENILKDRVTVEVQSPDGNKVVYPRPK